MTKIVDGTRIVHMGGPVQVIRLPKSEWLEFFIKVTKKANEFAIKLNLRPKR